MSEEKQRRRFVELHECTGCGLITNRPGKYMELIRAAAKISCCPERRLVAFLAERMP